MGQNSRANFVGGHGHRHIRHKIPYIGQVEAHRQSEALGKTTK